jgi:peptidoglycan/LPS O-acetylase OafA/YrhL
MRIALIFSFLAALVNALRPRFLLLLTGVTFLVGQWLAQHTLPTLGMLPLFLAGSALARMESLNPRTSVPGWMLFVGGGLIYCCGSLGFWSSLGRLVPMYAAGLGSACIMAGTIRSETIKYALCQPWLTFGGRCSYGVYLFHFPILLLTGWLVSGTQWSHGFLFPLVASASLFLAWMTWHLVELPFIRRGRKVSEVIIGSHLSQ